MYELWICLCCWKEWKFFFLYRVVVEVYGQLFLLRVDLICVGNIRFIVIGYFMIEIDDNSLYSYISLSYL